MGDLWDDAFSFRNKYQIMLIMVFFFSLPHSLSLFQIYHSPITKQEESESLLLLFLGLCSHSLEARQDFPCRYTHTPQFLLSCSVPAL